MSPVPEMIGRARLQETPGRLRVIIPAFRRAWSFLGFLEWPIIAGFFIWCLWQLWPASLFFAIWSTFIVAAVATRLAWWALGQEIVTVDKTALTLRTEIAGFGWTHFYELTRVSGLRLGEVVRISWDTRTPTGYGFLCFDYDSPRPWTETMFKFVAAWFRRGYDPHRPRFAKWMSEAEVRTLLKVMVGYTGAGASAI